MSIEVVIFIIASLAYIFFWVIPSEKHDREEKKRKNRAKEKRREIQNDKRSKAIKLIEKDFDSEVNDIFNSYTEKIKNAYRTYVKEDPFGEKDYKNFLKELDKFVYQKSLIWKQVEKLGYNVPFENYHKSMIKNLEEILDQESKDISYDDDMDPYEYEELCASLLRKSGWDAKVTKSSGDQGVDVLATKKKIKLIIQCKRFSKPVGNKAVQEVVAGIQYYSGTKGVVVAPNGFTTSAKQLANANNVLLIHHSEIKTL